VARTGNYKKIDNWLAECQASATGDALKVQWEIRSIPSADSNLAVDERLLRDSGPNAGVKNPWTFWKLLLYSITLLQCGLCDSRWARFQRSSCLIIFSKTLAMSKIWKNDHKVPIAHHLMSMKYFFKFLLIEKPFFSSHEIWKGYRATFGGALPNPFFLALNRLGAYGVGYTHYGNLKQVGEQESRTCGMVRALRCGQT